ncbi:hypothetical protein MITSMUL_03413 [Mitsuokella multacida DSM 20544]|uniref:Uncharacterized protein n=1 Tax=Mitsuokella multacida DSM 20544 TaxID=500635 RepID=C9KJS1_9FIRM|nr:hypothetical protein MITSMUL_03413 [Mitsuokella multacida DSM 20544]
MLHCLVFKEQLGLSKLAFLLSFESCLLQATFISYRIERSLSRSFFFLFSSSFELPANPLPIKAYGLLPLPYLSATCIMIQYTGQVVNTYFEKR